MVENRECAKNHADSDQQLGIWDRIVSGAAAEALLADKASGASG
jgi:hypothetical protein